MKHPPESSHGYSFEIYDITSGGFMRDLSPMTLGPVVDEFDDVLGCNIEDCWQGGKVWTFHMNGGRFDPKKANLWVDGSKELDPEGEEWIPEWKKWNEHICWSGEAKRHRAKVDKSKENPNVPLFSYYRGRRMPYENARQAMYCRWYDELVRKTVAYDYLKERFKAGVNLVLLDTDGQPRDEFPPESVTKEMAEKSIDDREEIFGHGKVLACVIQDINVWSKFKI